MKETLLVTADLHFTSDPKDAYRWDIFPWLKEQIEKYNVTQLIILSDLTEKKDKHDAQLVNRLVYELVNITKLCDIIVLKGNHDYVDSNTPFFGFLKQIKGVNFIVDPLRVGKYLFLPHSNNPEKDWSDIPLDCSIIFMHQCTTATELNSGYFVKTGFNANEFFKGYKGLIYSGDIHNPQEVGIVDYVGAPYPVHFGDTYDGRVLFIQDGKTSQLKYPCFKKWSLKINSIDELEKSEVESGDWLKLEYIIKQSDFFMVNDIKKKIRQYCELGGIKLCSLECKPLKDSITNRVRVKRIEDRKEVSNENILKRFATREKLDKEYIELGLALI